MSLALIGSDIYCWFRVDLSLVGKYQLPANKLRFDECIYLFSWVELPPPPFPTEDRKPHEIFTFY